MSAPRRSGGRIALRASEWMWRRARQGNGIWLGAALLVGSLRLIRRLAAPSRQVVYRGELAAGEELRIRGVGPDDGDGSSAS